MKSGKNTFSGFALAVTIASTFLLGACGQTGELYMPETFSSPPPQRTSQIARQQQQIPQEESIDNTEKNVKGN